MSTVRVVSMLVLLACALADSGCSSMQHWLSRDESERRAARLQEVQLKVMRYADDYSGRIRDPLEALNRQATSAEERLAAHDWRIMQSTAAYTIASGPNPIVNALDMIVLASLSRMVIEDSAVGGLSGPRAATLLEVHRDLEQQAWALVDGIADSDQMNHLRALIVQWRAEHPGAHSVSQVRLADFASIPGQRSDAAHGGGGGVFALIGLDPLSNLDPAVKELEQTRLLAERTIYYLQRAPSLLDMQIERLAYQLAIMPEAKQTLAGVERVSIAAEALGDLTADAPTIIARERHALVADLTATLHTEQERLQALLVEVRGVLKAGEQTSESVGTTVAALDTFVARFKPQDAQPGASVAPARRFDINDYAQTARDLGATAQDLQALLVQLDTSSAGVERLAGTTKQTLQEVVDRAFWRGLTLIGALAIAALSVALAYRYIAAFLPRARG
jgi:hypothetical protein